MSKGRSKTITEFKAATKANVFPLVPDWKVPNPSHLWVAGKPSKPDEWVEPKRITLEEALKLFNEDHHSDQPLEWCELPFGPRELIDECKMGREEASQQRKLSYETYCHNLKMLYESCAFRWVNSEMKWIVTVRKGCTLPPCDILATGSLVKDKSHGVESFEYRSFICENVEKGYIVAVDAKNYRNIANFLAFGLTEQTRSQVFDVRPEFQDKLSSQNVYPLMAGIDGYQVPILQIKEPIVALEQEVLLSWDYGAAYLRAIKESFKFFHRETFQLLGIKEIPLKKIEIQFQVGKEQYQLVEYSVSALSLINHHKDAVICLSFEINHDKKNHQLEVSFTALQKAWSLQQESPILFYRCSPHELVETVGRKELGAVSTAAIALNLKKAIERLSPEAETKEKPSVEDPIQVQMKKLVRTPSQSLLNIKFEPHPSGPNTLFAKAASEAQANKLVEVIARNSNGEVVAKPSSKGDKHYVSCSLQQVRELKL